MKKLAFLLALIFCLSLVACTKEVAPADVDDDDEKQSESGSENGETAGENGEGEGTAQEQGRALKKLFEIQKQVEAYNQNGLIYKDGSKYGILTLDGIHDTGAIYHKAGVMGEYFIVMMKDVSTPEDLSLVNQTGLVDAEGNILIPAEYADISEIGDGRYFKVCKATGLAASEDDTLVYLDTNTFSGLELEEDDVLYSGTWQVFDAKTKAFVDGVSGTKGYFMSASGELISYYDDAHNSIRVNSKGKQIPDNAGSLGDGYYTLWENNKEVIYDAFGSRLFALESENDKVLSFENGYFECSYYNPSTQDYTHKILDMTGKVVSTTFLDHITIYAKDVVEYQEKIVNFEGKALVDDKITSVYESARFWTLKNLDSKGSKQIYILDKSLNLLYSGTESDEIHLLSGDAPSKKVGQESLIYSFLQKDFVYSGRTVGNGYVSVKRSESEFDLVDTVNDQVLLEGYRYYSVELSKDGKMVVFAQTDDGTKEIFVKQ